MQLTFITGKGGVGKSAVTAGLATALSSLKYRVGVVELGETRMADFFKAPPPDYEGIKATPSISLLNLDAKSCFEEYISLHLPKQALPLLKNRWVEHFIDATPGLNEILLLGKITSLLTEKPWDFLLIDSPATGHTLSLCDAPRIALEALKHGPLKTTVEKIWDILHHPKTTNFLLVSQLENFIVQETIELYQHIHTTLNLSPKGLLINHLFGEEACVTDGIPKSFPQEAIPLVEILEATQMRQNREKELLKKLKKEIPLPVGQITRETEVVEETVLREKIGEALKPWVLKNYSQKNG